VTICGPIIDDDIFSLHINQVHGALGLLPRGKRCINGIQNTHVWYLVRLGGWNVDEENSRDEPKELWIHGRAYYRRWVCHSPNVMKTDIFTAQDGSESGKSTQGSIRFDSLNGFVIDHRR
jgi:hypothetical protein